MLWLVLNTFFFHLISHFITIFSIAEGYGKNKAGDKCLPICTDCVHGICIAPDLCKCDHGFGGPACDISKLHCDTINNNKINII